jgi:hypothetical protein
MAAKVSSRRKRPPFSRSVSTFLKFHAKKVGPVASMIWMALRQHEDWDTRECDPGPSLVTIARMIGVSVSSVQRHMHRLVKAGLLVMEPRWSPKGDQTSYYFRILNPDPEAVARRLQEMAAEQGQEGDSNLQPSSLQVATTPGLNLLYEQDFPLSQETPNREETACAEGIGEKTAQETPLVSTLPPSPDRQPCPHPLEERMNLGAPFCWHCKGWVEKQADTAQDTPETAEGGQADATSPE